MLAIMSTFSVMGSTIVLCTEIDGRSHVELAGNDCCQAESARVVASESTARLAEHGDLGGCVDCTDVSLSSDHTVVPRWRDFDEIAMCMQSCTLAEPITLCSGSHRIEIRGDPVGHRTRDSVFGFVILRLNR